MTNNKLREKWKKAQAAKVERNKQLIADIKAINCCQDCGGKFDPCVYEFHHEETPKYRVSDVFISTNMLIEEIEKCVLLCANCHRLRHKDDKWR